MIAHQRPCVDRRPGFVSQRSESPHKISSIRLVIDNPPLFNASNHHVVQGPWTIESCLPRHTFIPPDSLSVRQFVQLVNSVPFLFFTGITPSAVPPSRRSLQRCDRVSIGLRCKNGKERSRWRNVEGDQFALFSALGRPSKKSVYSKGWVEVACDPNRNSISRRNARINEGARKTAMTTAARSANAMGQTNINRVW
jgi:hypothetical protein